MEMLIPRGLVPNAPHYPDFSVCRSEYGIGILPADRPIAGDMLPRGENAITFYPGSLTEANRLPFFKMQGK